jgi:hypothetical protein
MTRHQLAAAMYAPFRIVLYENEQGRAVFEYDKPSSLFGQFGDERVTMIALELDVAIERVLECVADESHCEGRMQSVLPMSGRPGPAADR